MTGCRIEPEILLAFISSIGIHFFPPKDCREKPGQQMTGEPKDDSPGANGDKTCSRDLL